jgi:cytochrome c oxidase assembly factor CtaG
MPSTVRQFRQLSVHFAVWLVWLPMAGKLRHDRTYGELKRLQPIQAAALLLPFASFVTIGAWVYTFFPRELVTWVGLIYVAAFIGGGVLVFSTLFMNRVLSLYNSL